MPAVKTAKRPKRTKAKLPLPKLAPTAEHCNSRKGKGGYCKRPAGWGTDHAGFGRCKLHGGSTKLAGRGAALAEAAKVVERYGLPVQTDPHTALIEELERTAGHVAWLRLKVDEVAEDTTDALVGPVGQSGPSESGGYHHPSYEPNVWLGLYQEERKHLVKVAQVCIAAGIAERKVRLAEEHGAMLAQIIKGVLKELGVADDPKAGTVVRKYLTLARDQVEGEPIKMELEAA